MLVSSLQNFAASTASGCSGHLLGLKTWFAYFPNSWFGGTGYSKCDVNNTFQLLPGNSGPSGLLLIGLAILDDLIRIAALVAVGYVIYGGVQYVTSQGSPDATNKARQTIINALVGLGIAIISTGLVSFIGAKLGNISS